MSGLSRIGLLKTQQSQDMQELFWLAISNLSPPFSIPRTDPVGHFHWPMTRQLITANRTSIIAFESTSTANSTTFTSLPSQCLSNTLVRTCLFLFLTFLMFCVLNGELR